MDPHEHELEPAVAPLAPILGTVAAFQVPLGLASLALYLVPGLLTAAWVYWYRHPAARAVGADVRT